MQTKSYPHRGTRGGGGELLVLIKLIKPYLKRIQCNDKFWENGRAVDAKKRDPLRKGGGYVCPSPEF